MNRSGVLVGVYLWQNGVYYNEDVGEIEMENKGNRLLINFILSK